MIKKHDFVEIEYTGRIKEDNTIFDTTDSRIAKENELEGTQFGPVIVCVGENLVLKGLDKSLENKEIGSTYSIEISPQEGFGNKDGNLIQMIPTSKFLQQKIQPMPGMQLNIDGILGTIKTVSGGRTLVDFNHPLAGKMLSYDVKIKRDVTEDKEKLLGYLSLVIGTKDIEAEVDGSKAKIKLKMELPVEMQQELKQKIIELISLKDIEFIFEKVKNK